MVNKRGTRAYCRKAVCASLITGVVAVSLTSCGVSEPSVVFSPSASSSAASGSPATDNAQKDYHIGDRAGSFLTDNIGSAKVFITEFTDFQCPACAGMQATIKKLVDKYSGTDVAVVVRNFPLPSHSNAQTAAQAAEAAAIQGKYGEYVTQLYASQKDWSNLDAGAVTAKLTDIAKGLGLDLKKFNTDMNSPATKELVSKDLSAGQDAGVNGTPTLFVGTEKVVIADGARYSDVQSQIENMVEEARKASSSPN